jgi:hypothetical protein
MLKFAGLMSTKIDLILRKFSVERLNMFGVIRPVTVTFGRRGTK